MLTKRGKRLSAVGVLVAALVAIMIPAPVRWRAEVVLLSLAGRIPDIELKQLLAYMMPGSGQWLRPLIETRNPYAVIRNVKTTPADIQAGATLFRSRCAECHAPDGSGGRGPRLIGRQFTHGESDWAVYRTIRFGIPNTTMGPHPLPDTAVWQLEAFVRSIDTSGSTLGATGRGSRGAASVPVPYDELAAIREPGEDWLTYSGSYWASRHSALSQINRGNVGHLALRWIHQLEGAPDCVEVSPVVRKGVMFVTQPPSRVLALDATTGKEIWAYDHQVSRGGPTSDVNDFSAAANRGVAVLTDKVFFGTPDAHLIAVSAATGALQWEATVATDVTRYAITAAPLAYRDLVVTGVAIRGSAAGGQGFVAAYDANTGKERWRFVAIPKPGEPGNETWEGDSWRDGGAPTWLTGSYDPELDLLVWPVGNPKPDYDAAARRGDNLYTNSAVALRGSTGALVWYFQFTPGDDHDWDATEIPVLEQGMVFFTASPPAAISGRPFYTAVRALDASTGTRVWESRREPRLRNDRLGGVRMGGLLSTRGGIVFGGDQTTFFALDSRTGTPLWSVETGGTICAAPVTFSTDREQFVVIAAGRNLLAFALPNAP